MGMVIEGTAATVVGSDVTLATITAQGAFTLSIDLSNLAEGEVVELRTEEKILSGSTYKAVYGPFAYTGGAFGEPIKVTTPVPAAHGVKWIIKQLNGTARNCEFRVDRP